MSRMQPGRRKRQKAYDNIVKPVYKTENGEYLTDQGKYFEVVNDTNETAGNRISAARSILEYGLKLTEFNDILQDLEALEG